VGSAAVILVAMVVMMVAIETMMVVMMMIMVMVLGTLTQVPFHHDLSSPPFFWLFPFQPLPPYINIRAPLWFNIPSRVSLHFMI
jgi:hypothetical protein